MKNHSGEMISVGDRVKYNGQKGSIALVSGESRSASPSIKLEEWDLNDGDVLILFSNGARLLLNEVPNDELLMFSGRSG